MRYMLIGARLLFALLTLVALIVSFIDFMGGRGRDPINSSVSSLS
jgi:hypothetical protein